MKKNAPQPRLLGRPYSLSEEGHLKLHEIRDQLMLLADLTMPSTQEEEDEPLRLQRSALGECFERISFQVDQVLDDVGNLDCECRYRPDYAR